MTIKGRNAMRKRVSWFGAVRSWESFTTRPLSQDRGQTHPLDPGQFSRQSVARVKRYCRRASPVPYAPYDVSERRLFLEKPFRLLSPSRPSPQMKPTRTHTTKLLRVPPKAPHPKRPPAK